MGRSRNEVAYRSFVKAMRNFLKVIDDGGVLPAEEMDKLLFDVLWAALNVLRAQQGEYLDFLSRADNRFRFESWLEG